ncbi:hypothetical protein BJ322DRAFT_1039160 [Thelephora terrestris]|uniref:Transcription factor TFIIIC triple barrel domain-containing protein n=1 Tax=Thelephora terrestris TaxID=56493 RepID=A0A9P6HMX8_9AGAM|nr:hypothetical protein BJ322DRAFT_1039160 [Thelephora terrestris]
MPAESLVPGYKLVSYFGPDSEYETRPSVTTEGEEEVEEEVEYVTLEIPGIADVDPNLLTSYRLIGLDTPTPFLQLSSSGTIFKGRHHKLLGTELLFTHSQGDSDPDPSTRRISLLGTTEKRVVFSPVEVRDPASPSSTPGHASKGKTPGKESSPKKGKKKASFWTCGIEEVVGGLGVVGPAAESGVSTRSRSRPAGREKGDDAALLPVDEDDDDLYASEGEGGDEGVGGDGQASEVDLRSPATTTPSMSVAPAVATEPNVAQSLQEHGAPPTEVPMAIDPALEVLHVPRKQASP